MPTCTTPKASVKANMNNNLRELSRIVDMVPALKHNLLMTASKFADANYITVLTPKELLIHDGNELKLQASGQAISTGWI